VVALFGAAWGIYNIRVLLEPESFDRQWRLRLALHGIERALLLSLTIGAAAGFTSCHPVPRMRLFSSLLVVLVGSLAAMVPMMWLLESVGLEMRATKAVQPSLLLSEIVTYIASPAIAAVAIYVYRRTLASQKKHAEQSLAAESR
jgi:predicted membrane channel-forming protein YqfA (hemolysin III family)